MNKLEAQVIETDVVLFPMKANQAEQTPVSVRHIESETVAVESSVNQDSLQTKFARLRKNMRKRALGIL